MAIFTRSPNHQIKITVNISAYTIYYLDPKFCFLDPTIIITATFSCFVVTSSCKGMITSKSKELTTLRALVVPLLRLGATAQGLQVTNSVNLQSHYYLSHVYYTVYGCLNVSNTIYSRLCERSITEKMVQAKTVGCIYTFIEIAWSLGLLYTYTKWHRFSRPDHFWLGWANFGSHSWSPGPNFSD